MTYLSQKFGMLRVGIVEDHTEFRQSLEFLISSSTGYEVAWAFGSVEAALQQAVQAELMLLDINLPVMSGIDAIPHFRKMFPSIKIIMLTIQEDEGHIFQAIRAGADGYILKKTGPEKIMEAIGHVKEGGAALTPLVARQVLSFFQPAGRPEPNEMGLTSREREILDFIVHGASTLAIADQLFISPQTVRNHIKKIYEKLQVHSRAQAVAKAFREKLV
jgi:DNA-binding NarL/FixJ family response regulator